MTILQYLHSRKTILIPAFSCGCINIIVLFLYGNHVEPILYAFAIYLVFLIFFGFFDYRKQAKKHKLLLSYDIAFGKPLTELLPESDILMADYQNIILKLEELQRIQTNAHTVREKELSDFYTLWVHQIKTPIAALRLLLQTSPEHISEMKSEVFKIERYVDIILGYLRMEDMNQDLLVRHYSLEGLVKQAVKKYSPLFIQSKLSLTLENLSLSVLTDEKWLVFSIEQLLSNAIKYTPAGSIRIYANAACNDEILTATLFIEDTGIGIAPEDLPRIFERSFTGYNGRADKKASGLGLYLCKTILTRLGHKISITSRLQEGTRVAITFTENRKLRPTLTKS